MFSSIVWICQIDQRRYSYGSHLKWTQSGGLTALHTEKIQVDKPWWLHICVKWQHTQTKHKLPRGRSVIRLYMCHNMELTSDPSPPQPASQLCAGRAMCQFSRQKWRQQLLMSLLPPSSCSSPSKFDFYPAVTTSLLITSSYPRAKWPPSSRSLVILSCPCGHADSSGLIPLDFYLLSLSPFPLPHTPPFTSSPPRSSAFL